jgi:MinD-like ATPase involved in chromosome partitioning or flagellar assembly
MNTNYEAQNQIKKSMLTDIDSSINILSQLLENMKNYRACINDFFQLQQENEGIETKSFADILYQSHTLPGVISMPQVSKDDIEKREEVKNNIEKSLEQKRIYFHLIDKDSDRYIQAFNAFKKNDEFFEYFLNILNGNINLSLQPRILPSKVKASKPNINLKINTNEPLSKVQ